MVLRGYRVFVGVGGCRGGQVGETRLYCVFVLVVLWVSCRLWSRLFWGLDEGRSQDLGLLRLRQFEGYMWGLVGLLRCKGQESYIQSQRGSGGFGFLFQGQSRQSSFLGGVGMVYWRGGELGFQFGGTSFVGDLQVGVVWLRYLEKISYCGVYFGG